MAEGDVMREMLNILTDNIWGRRAGMIIFILFSTMVLISLVHIPLSLQSDYRLVHTSPTPSPSTETTDSAMQLVSKIPEWHLFGFQPVTKETKNLPVTSLQLRLLGVITATPLNLSRIIISEQGKPGKIYAVGDNISGVTVNAIVENGVILENAGQLEKLPLQRETLMFHGMPKKLN